MGKKDDPFFLKYLKHIGKKIRRFLTSRDLLIFLFFLIVSTGLWSLRALKKEYETIITIPISYEKAPTGLVQQSELPENLLVTVTDNGATLVRYRWMHKFSPISIDVGSYTDGRYSINTADFESAIQRKLNTSTKIIRIMPKQINLEFEQLTKKEVPVKFNGTVSMAPQYIGKGEMEIKPSHVTVYGTKEIIDSTTSISTEYTEIKDVKEELNQKIRLIKTPNLSFSDDSVHCIMQTERRTEKTIEVPIRTKNVDDGYKMRTFPVTAKVKFQIGISNYNQVSADKFMVFADYNDAIGSRIPLRITGLDNPSIAVEIVPSTVEYILEKK